MIFLLNGTKIAALGFHLNKLEHGYASTFGFELACNVLLSMMKVITNSLIDKYINISKFKVT